MSRRPRCPRHPSAKKVYLARSSMPGMKLSVGSPSRPTPHVAGDDPRDRPVLPVEHVGGGEPGEHLRSELLGLNGEPPAEVPEADDVVAVVLERGREQPVRPREPAPLGEEEEALLAHRRVEGRFALAPVREELLEGAGLEHRTGQDVGADLGALLDHADAQVVAPLRGELAEPDGRGESRTDPRRRSPRRTPWIRARSPPRPYFRPRSSAGPSPAPSTPSERPWPVRRTARGNYKVPSRIETGCLRGALLVDSGPAMALASTPSPVSSCVSVSVRGSRLALRQRIMRYWTSHLGMSTIPPCGLSRNGRCACSWRRSPRRSSR